MDILQKKIDWMKQSERDRDLMPFLSFVLNCRDYKAAKSFLKFRDFHGFLKLLEKAICFIDRKGLKEAMKKKGYEYIVAHKDKGRNIAETEAIQTKEK